MVAALVAGAGAAHASPYDTVLPQDTYVLTPTVALINILHEINCCGKREWVTFDTNLPPGTYLVTQGPNGRLVDVGVGAGLLAESARQQRAEPLHLTEYQLVLQVAGQGPDILGDLDGDSDIDVVWTHSALVAL